MAARGSRAPRSELERWWSSATRPAGYAWGRICICVCTCVILAAACRKPAATPGSGARPARVEQVPAVARERAARYAAARVVDVSGQASSEVVSGRASPGVTDRYRLRAPRGAELRVSMSHAGSKQKPHMELRYYLPTGMAPSGHASSMTCAEPGCTMAMTIAKSDAGDLLLAVLGRPAFAYRLTVRRLR